VHLSVSPLPYELSISAASESIESTQAPRSPEYNQAATLSLSIPKRKTLLDKPAVAPTFCVFVFFVHSWFISTEQLSTQGHQGHREKKSEGR
jgi:hypothetical protein